MNWRRLIDVELWLSLLVFAFAVALLTYGAWWQ